uniref:Sugar kinases, ribokinase family n=1 Tax=Candidatus Actinomarina minuta TaxID=1389454 RepID=S5DLE6_9ACTN|nr:sugar kinases, ribokinase family [Candidatus Actinomarina minuta]
MIVCIGNALVDTLQQIDENIIEKLDLNKARMTLVDKERSNFLLENMPNPTYAAGGSAANTAYWISVLGGQAGFIGKVSNDDLGKQFKSSLSEHGLKDLTVYEEGDDQTGLCAIFITPDGERTMNTYLGAGAQLSMSDLNEQAINKCNILYMEGYLWDRLPSKEAFIYASNVNKLSGGKNALSLSDVFCVEAHRDSFLDLIKDNIDIVFCNEDELNTLTKQNSVEESVKFVNKYFPNLDQLICTLGPKGVLVIKNKTEYFYEATEAEVVDKTGAGDYFAAGYLYGIENDFSIEDAALIANKSAAHVISEIGVRPEKPFSL